MSQDDPYHDRKIYHLGYQFAGDNSGRVSALCFKRPHGINLSRERWTLIPDHVTCQKCRAIMNQSPEDFATPKRKAP